MPQLYFPDNQGLVITDQGRALKFDNPLTPPPTAMGLPDAGFFGTLQGYLGCDWTSLTPEEDVALLILSVAHPSGGAGAYKHLLQGKGIGPWHILLEL